jgi:bacteriorhodopsin
MTPDRIDWNWALFAVVLFGCLVWHVLDTFIGLFQGRVTVEPLGYVSVLYVTARIAMEKSLKDRP